MLLLSNECLCLIRNGELSLCAMRPESLPVPVSRFDTLSPSTLYWDRHLATVRTRRVCSFCSMRAVGADPRTHRLMMHAQLASDAPVTHALFCKRQSLSFSRLIWLPDTWLRGKVQLARTAAKSLTPRSIFPAFDALSHLVTLRAYGKNAS